MSASVDARMPPEAREGCAPPQLRLDAFLPYQLSIASNAVSGAIARSYESLFGLKVPEWRLIAVLAETDGLTQQQIVQRTEMDKMTVSRAAQALAGRGLVARARDGRDRRSQMLTLSPAGQTLYGEIAPRALALEAQLMAGFAEPEIAALRAALARLKQAAEALR
jgi:DNA-binding MarR family transcriptional regulator